MKDNYKYSLQVGYFIYLVFINVLFIYVLYLVREYENMIFLCLYIIFLYFI